MTYERPTSSLDCGAVPPDTVAPGAVIPGAVVSETSAVRDVPLDALREHPANPNVMSRDVMAKLARHIRRTGCYPPLIVRQRHAHADDTCASDARPVGQTYELLDGHQRLRVLRRLKHPTARCVVWDVNDQEALLLLATLNRLHGDDDPRKRGDLLRRLSDQLGSDRLPRVLPETQAQLSRLTALETNPPALRPPDDVTRMPVAVHFFLLPEERRRLERVLRAWSHSREATREATREAALMALVDSVDAGPG